MMLTKRQKEILDYLEAFLKKNSYAPSIREIGERFKLSSPATVHVHLKNLKDKGMLNFDFNIPRSLKLIKKGLSEAIEIPLAGLITAGEPIEAIEQNETIGVPRDFIGNSANSFVLEVKGESMIDDGILDGDYVIVEQKQNPQNGDTVVALIDNTYATLKKFYREDKRIRLQPANKKMKAIYAKDVKIQGVVRGIMRKFL